MGDRAQRVRDVMATEVVTLEAGDHLDLASDIMTLGRIRHMPVVREGKLVGILSQRDLFRGAVSSVLQLAPAAEREWLAKIRVAEVMTAEVVTAEPDWPVRQAVEVMLKGRFGCLPVVDAENRVVGLLSESDCLRLLDAYLGEAT
jgi:CBS domain-containing membrane protein